MFYNLRVFDYIYQTFQVFFNIQQKTQTPILLAPYKLFLLQNQTRERFSATGGNNRAAAGRPRRSDGGSLPTS